MHIPGFFTVRLRHGSSIALINDTLFIEFRYSKFKGTSRERSNTAVVVHFVFVTITFALNTCRLDKVQPERQISLRRSR
jgi:hypothetical protein